MSLFDKLLEIFGPEEPRKDRDKRRRPPGAEPWGRKDRGRERDDDDDDDDDDNRRGWDRNKRRGKRGEKRRDDRREGRKPDRSPAPSPSVPHTAGKNGFDYDDERIPESSRERIGKILASLKETEALMDREQVQAVNRTEIELMREEHLPKLVKSYVDIPPAHRGEIFRKTGKSASFILDESLDAMQSKIDDIMRNLAQHDLDAFANNAAFISRRYNDEDPFG